VRLTYLPQAFVIGAWISSVTMFVLLIAYFTVRVFAGTKRLSTSKFFDR